VVIAGGGPTGLMLAGDWCWRPSTLYLSSAAPARTSPAHAPVGTRAPSSRAWKCSDGCFFPCGEEPIGDPALIGPRPWARRSCRARRHGRTASATRRGDGRPGHPLQPRRRAPAARTPYARSRSGHRRRATAPDHPAARCPTGAAQLPSAQELRHHFVGRGFGCSTFSAWARGSFRHSIRSRRPRRRIGPARRACVMGGRPDAVGAADAMGTWFTPPVAT
jgi:hypothetical protein